MIFVYIYLAVLTIIAWLAHVYMPGKLAWVYSFLLAGCILVITLIAYSLYFVGLLGLLVGMMIGSKIWPSKFNK